MYRTITKILPKKLRDNLKQLLIYANIPYDPDQFIGFVLLSCILLSFAITFNLLLLVSVPFFLLLPGIFIFLLAFFYFWLLLTADKKGKFIEQILPDALQLMASNLRAGLTTDKALLLSARQEFGPFQDEINMVGKEITLGKPIADAL